MNHEGNFQVGILLGLEGKFTDSSRRGIKKITLLLIYSLISTFWLLPQGIPGTFGVVVLRYKETNGHCVITS